MIFVNGVLFGFGLAADAFLISLSNGLNAPDTRLGKIFAAASVFALFQFIAPLSGWLCVHTVAETFSSFEKYICLTAFFVLCFMGFKMIYGGMVSSKIRRGLKREKGGLSALIAQGILTSADALSVGFAVSELSAANALITAFLISAVTFAVYSAGFFIGRRFGGGFASNATVLGGLVLIAVGTEALLGTFL